MFWSAGSHSLHLDSSCGSQRAEGRLSHPPEAWPHSLGLQIPHPVGRVPRTVKNGEYLGNPHTAHEQVPLLSNPSQRWANWPSKMQVTQYKVTWQGKGWTQAWNQAVASGDQYLPPAPGEAHESSTPSRTRVGVLLPGCLGPSPGERPGKPVLESTEKAMARDISHCVFRPKRLRKET